MVSFPHNYYLDHITPRIERNGKSVRSVERYQCFIGVRTDAEFLHFIIVFIIIRTFFKLNIYTYLLLTRKNKIGDEVKMLNCKYMYFFS